MLLFYMRGSRLKLSNNFKSLTSFNKWVNKNRNQILIGLLIFIVIVIITIITMIDTIINYDSYDSYDDSLYDTQRVPFKNPIVKEWVNGCSSD